MTLNCPQCSKDVPEYAKLCKYCFHDFASKSERKFPLGLAVGLFAISLLAMFGTVAWAQDALDGKTESLVRHRQHLLPFVDFLFNHSNPLPCKVLMHHMGLLNNETRLPLLALTENDYELPLGWERLG